MEHDPIRHEQIMKKIEIQVRKDQHKEMARKQRFQEIQQRLKREVQANNVGQ
jgi:hypothetical protein